MPNTHKKAEAKDFSDFNLPEKLLQALKRMHFTSPTPIQEQTIALTLEGRDVLGTAQTGTGKTGAFGIPIIAKLMENPQAAALILTPTRELAAQVMAALQQMIPVPEIKTALLIGGEPMPRQFRQLDHNPRLVVCTPGRINDHLKRGKLKLQNTRYLVLDETDRMLDMGFGVQIEEIMKFMSLPRQTLMFSATLPANIIKLSGKYLDNPARVAVGSTTAPAKNIKQESVHVGEADKYQQLLIQLEKRDGSVIVFVKTKYGSERLADRLNKADHKADAIHGDLQQKKRDRVIQAFRDKKYRILVATDVAARGLDIPHIEHVVNYDLPQVPEDYIHRIGRTARAGAEGQAVNLLTPADKGKWNAITRLLGGDDDTSPAPQRKGGGRGNSGGFKGKPSFKGKRDNDRAKGKSRARDDRFARGDGEAPRKSFSRDDRPKRDWQKRDWRDEKPRGEGGDQHPRRNRDEVFFDRDRPRSFGGRNKPRDANDNFARGDRPSSFRDGDKPRNFGGRDKPRSGDKPRSFRDGEKPRSFDKKPGGKTAWKGKSSGGKNFGKPSGGKPSGNKGRFGKR